MSYCAGVWGWVGETGKRRKKRKMKGKKRWGGGGNTTKTQTPEHSYHLALRWQG